MSHDLHRRAVLTLATGALAATPALAVQVPVAAAPSRYRITLLSVSPPRFTVEADLPGAGERLEMGESWPAELPEMARQGWPALVSDLTASDAAGPLPLSLQRNHWRLDRPAVGRVRLTYAIDYGLFERAGWSSPLESAVSDGETLAVHGRGLFVTGAEAAAEVAFVLPAGWRPMAPWRPLGGGRFGVRDLAQLKDNMLAISTAAPLTVSAGGFTLRVAAMGPWRPLAGAVSEALRRIVRREVALMGWRGREAFNVVLTPLNESGGEAYRQSLAMGFDGPSVENRPGWANFLAHEIFHFWNASRLKGADYASTQWFQEGFTEYVANLTLLAEGIASPEWFLDKLSTHVANAARLETTLENIGTRKGPPLYSSGALVAFAFDVTIRRASGGRRDLGAFFRNLWRATGEASRPYAWPDIRLALEATAAGDWEGFHQRHIRGDDDLPLAGMFAEAGLRFEGGKVSVDPAAAAKARAIWASLQR